MGQCLRFDPLDKLILFDTKQTVLPIVEKVEKLVRVQNKNNSAQARLGMNLKIHFPIYSKEENIGQQCVIKFINTTTTDMFCM